MNITEDSFSDFLKKGSFFLLIKPEDNIYSNTFIRNSFFDKLDSLVKLGLKNIEISWSNNENGWILYPISRLNIQELIQALPP